MAVFQPDCTFTSPLIISDVDAPTVTDAAFAPSTHARAKRPRFRAGPPSPESRYGAAA